jgi:hypothetical protein
MPGGLLDGGDLDMGGLDGGDGPFGDPSMDFPGMDGGDSDMPPGFDQGMDVDPAAGGMDDGSFDAMPDPSAMEGMDM